LFSGRVLAMTEDVVVRWKTMIVDGRKRGHTFGQPDLFRVVRQSRAVIGGR
jgi:toxin FitB